MGRRSHGGVAGGSGLGGLSATDTTITAQNNTDIVIDPEGTGQFAVDGPQLVKDSNEIRFGDGDSSNYVAFKAPATVSSNVSWTLPDADATTANQSLVSDGSGVLSFVTTGAQITDDTTDSSPEYLIFGTATTGTLLNVSTSSSKLTYTPSTGEIAADAADISGTVKYYSTENVYTTDHTLALVDRNRVVSMNNSGAANITIPANSSVAFPIGTIIHLYKQAGAGDVTLGAAGGVTVNKTGKLGTQEELYIRKRATDAWVVVDVPTSLTASGGTVSAGGGFTIHSYTSGTDSFVI
jgi:hypothetical protein